MCWKAAGLLPSADLWAHEAVADGARGQATLTVRGLGPQQPLQVRSATWTPQRPLRRLFLWLPVPSQYPTRPPALTPALPCPSGVTGASQTAGGPLHTPLLSEGSELVPGSQRALGEVPPPRSARTQAGWAVVWKQIPARWRLGERTW